MCPKGIQVMNILSVALELVIPVGICAIPGSTVVVKIVTFTDAKGVREFVSSPSIMTLTKAILAHLKCTTAER
ncbi:hypothetical protein FRC02_011491 [Tulasnella sp. 418]|nr:hypothetical protein FRC02_011491 [Tulasnella sp. 418]